MTIQACGSEHNLALWLTPDAIREAFEDDPANDPTKYLSDEDLEQVGYGILDRIHDEYRRLLDSEISDIAAQREADAKIIRKTHSGEPEVWP